jgi:hypothetical protein
MAEMGMNDFIRKTLDRQDRLIRAVGIKLFNGVIRDTPVGDPDLWHPPVRPPGYVGGRLRGNWRCSLGMADPTSDEVVDTARSSRAVDQTCANGNRHDSFWLSNSLPYAHRIEYDGWSSQAPEGMVRRNTVRIKRIISQELQRLKLLP